MFIRQSYNLTPMRSDYHVQPSIIHNSLALVCVVAMVTNFKSLNLLYGFIAMETPIVLNNFPKNNISVITFLISVKNDLYTILLVVMVP